jgi:branched-chain amino acid transport system substrate-binding protein
VVGNIAYAKDGTWTESRTLFTQFQNVAADNVDQFRDGSVQPVLWPPECKTGTMIYPYAEAKR